MQSWDNRCSIVHMIRKHIFLDLELIKKVNKHKKKTGLSFGEIVRIALREYFVGLKTKQY